MSGITRYAVIETALCIGSNLMEGEVFMVMATDHDRELAALREELAGLQSSCAIDRRHLDRMIDHSDHLLERASAAEQRNAAMTDLLDSISKCYAATLSLYTLDKIAAVLAKPTESGASE